MTTRREFLALAPLALLIPKRRMDLSDLADFPAECVAELARDRCPRTRWQRSFAALVGGNLVIARTVRQYLFQIDLEARTYRFLCGSRDPRQSTLFVPRVRRWAGRRGFSEAR